MKTPEQIAEQAAKAAAKAAEKAKKDAEKKAAKEKAAADKESAKLAKPKFKKYTRINAICETLKDGHQYNRDELAQAANALYVERGGADNITESGRIVDTRLEALFELGIFTDGVYPVARS
jgi:hypothetical protein